MARHDSGGYCWIPFNPKYLYFHPWMGKGTKSVRSSSAASSSKSCLDVSLTSVGGIFDVYAKNFRIKHDFTKQSNMFALI